MGRVINTLTSRSLFCVHPHTPLRSDPLSDPAIRKSGQRLSQSFSSAFGGADIYPVLAAFNGRNTLTDAIAQFPRVLQPNGLDVTVWLIRFHGNINIYRLFLTNYASFYMFLFLSFVYPGSGGMLWKSCIHICLTPPSSSLPRHPFQQHLGQVQHSGCRHPS